MPPAPTSDKSTAASRGRNVASKPLIAAAKSKSVTPVSASGKASRTPSESSTVSVKSTSSARSGKITNATSSTSRTPSETGFKVTKLSSSTVTLQSTWSPKPISESTKASVSGPPLAAASTPISEQPLTSTSDPLQLAAQVYPWIYMSSTLDACFDNAETAATNDLETRVKVLSTEESEISDKRERMEAERAIEFYDELGSDAFIQEAPAIMKLFHSHGDSCNRIETEALKLAMRDTPDLSVDEPLKVYQDMLQELDGLSAQATDLQESILKLTQTEPPATANEGVQSETDASSARSQVTGVFTACLPVLRARLANLSMAQELIDSTLENVSLGLRMESMGLND